MENKVSVINYIKNMKIPQINTRQNKFDFLKGTFRRKSHKLYDSSHKHFFMLNLRQISNRAYQLRNLLKLFDFKKMTFFLEQDV